MAAGTRLTPLSAAQQGRVLNASRPVVLLASRRAGGLWTRPIPPLPPRQTR